MAIETARGRRRRVHVGASWLAAIVMAAFPYASADGTASRGQREQAGGYGWPVVPFHHAHPVRGNFGDPRTIFRGPPSQPTLLHGRGDFAFHKGVDIVAPAGTRVYPVRDGSVTEIDPTVGRQRVTVVSTDGTTFQYWHIRALVQIGQSVISEQTVLGTTLREVNHVDLTELDGGHAVNPLQIGHLTPYADATRPVVEAVRLQTDNAGHPAFPSVVHGRLVLVTEASDRPAMSVPGIWHGMPVTPALVKWRIQTLDGRTVWPEQIAADFRSTVPPDNAFWAVYARGTFQNMAVFGKHYCYRQPGAYVFRLGTTTFDTHRLANGVYDLVVTASDLRGNSGSRTLRFTIRNAPPLLRR